MADLLKATPISRNIVRFFSKKGKIRSDLAAPSCTQEKLESAPLCELPVSSIRYKVCQERTPVYKTLPNKSMTYEQMQQAVNLQKLQPSMLPIWTSKINK